MTDAIPKIMLSSLSLSLTDLHSPAPQDLTIATPFIIIIRNTSCT